MDKSVLQTQKNNESHYNLYIIFNVLQRRLLIRHYSPTSQLRIVSRLIVHRKVTVMQRQIAFVPKSLSFFFG